MPKILIIENEAVLREEIFDWMRFEGYEVVSAADGLAGLQEAILHQPDVILSDITMPYLDGYGVLAALRENPQTASIPFMFMTALSSQEAIEKGMGIGADDYLTKPFGLNELLQRVQRLLEKPATQQNSLQDSEE
jgi:DNA-binding response OmpR family regulator